MAAYCKKTIYSHSLLEYQTVHFPWVLGRFIYLHGTSCCGTYSWMNGWILYFYIRYKVHPEEHFFYKVLKGTGIFYMDSGQLSEGDSNVHKVSKISTS